MADWMLNIESRARMRVIGFAPEKTGENNEPSRAGSPSIRMFFLVPLRRRQEKVVTKKRGTAGGWGSGGVIGCRRGAMSHVDRHGEAGSGDELYGVAGIAIRFFLEYLRTAW